MTRFLNGPASGQKLMLKTSPPKLRVVEDRGKWDALDLPTDEPRPGETIHRYRLVRITGNIHINSRGGRGGFYPMAEYELDL